MLTFRGGDGFRMSGIGGPSQIVYIPDLAPVGSKSSYFPRDVEQDAAALVFLGFLSDSDDAERFMSTGEQGGDIQTQSGAWDPRFRAAVGRFQSSAGITADTWIGPQTRTSLAAAVARKNATGFSPVAVPTVVVPVAPGQVPISPAAVSTPLPGVQPVSQISHGEDNTMLYVGIGAAVLGVGGLAYFAMK